MNTKGAALGRTLVRGVFLAVLSAAVLAGGGPYSLDAKVRGRRA